MKALAAGFTFCFALLCSASHSSASTLTELMVRAGSLQSGFAKDVQGEGKSGLESWKARSLRFSDEFYQVMEELHRSIEALPPGNERNEWMGRFNKFLTDAIPSETTYSRLFKSYELRLLRFPGRAVALLFVDGPNGQKVLRDFCRLYVDRYVEREPPDGVETALYRVRDQLNARALFIPIEVNRVVTEGDFQAKEPRFSYYKAMEVVGYVKNIPQLKLLHYLRANADWGGSLFENLPSLSSVIEPVVNDIPLIGLQAYLNSDQSRWLSLKDFVKLKTFEELDEFRLRMHLSLDICKIEFDGFY